MIIDKMQALYTNANKKNIHTWSDAFKVGPTTPLHYKT